MTHHSPIAATTPTTARAVRASGFVALAASVAVLLTAPATADAHGGVEVAAGGGGGTRIAVQGSPAGVDEVDLATTLTGPGSGEGSKVTYWIRPAGRKRSVRVDTDRDESGIHHAEIPTAGRGSWQEWDVAAYVTTSTGRRLRVTNDRSDPPGPPEQERPSTAATPSSGVTTSAAPAPEPTDTPSAATVEDVSGEGDDTPGWVVPSILVLVVAGGAAAVVRHRRLPRDDE